jgi:hypothetical protein
VRFTTFAYRLPALVLTVVVTACGVSGSPSAAASSGVAQASQAIVARHDFLGAFFRPVGVSPYGVFSVYSKQRPPEPYPAPTTTLFGRSGYCDEVAANGFSISSGYKVDEEKLANIVKLGVKWTRTPVSADFDDQSHIFGPGKYSFGDFDSAQCALLRAKIAPIVNIEAGSVQYNPPDGAYAPKELPNYRTAADFGEWCGAIAKHELRTFPSVTRYSLPGNEVNSDPKTYPGGDAEIAAYAKACYHAVKVAEPNAFVYGFELNMEKDLDPAAFVQRMYNLACKQGTCYDAISLHLYMHYPLPAPGAPCYPSPGGNYTLQCIADVQKATHAPNMHILVGETALLVPATVPNEETKAKAVVDIMELFASQKLIDGLNYANVDECDLYPSGFFVGGCLIDSIGNPLPAYMALQKLATRYYQ